MLAEQIRRAILAAPRAKLCDLSVALWKAYGAGLVADDEAQQLAEEIAARKIVPPKPAEPRRRVGSRPRSPAAMERRRRWTSSGWLPPQLAARFTMGEAAALSAIAAEVARRGLCRLTIGHIAALAGVGRTTVQNAVRQAVALGILKSEEWRLTAWRSAPNTVRIVSAEWRAWLRMRDRKRAGTEHPRQAEQGREARPQAKPLDTRQHLATSARGRGFRTATTLRITDSFPPTSDQRDAPSREDGMRRGAGWSR